MRVLLIEDDCAVSQSIAMILRGDGMCVDIADCGEDGIEIARHCDYDVIALDLGLPDMSGFEVVRSLRWAKVAVPVIVLSGSANVEDKIDALKAGADDYLTKPFSIEELTVRLSALTRRSMGGSDTRIRFGPMTLDLAAKTLEAHGRRIDISTREYQILELLCLRRGVMVSKQTLISHIHGDGESPDNRAMDVFMHDLRRKLAAACEGDRFIETVRDRGYLMQCAA